MHTFSRERYERCKKYGDVTSQGVVFFWELSGPDGAWFCLFKEDHSKEVLAAARRELRNSRDVTGFGLAVIEDEPAIV